jgi:toxin ParE1/3/4
LLTDAANVADIRFSPAARSDLATIDEYSAEQFGDDVADAYARGFMETFELLARHPYAGALRPELGDDIRCQLHRRHRVFYRVDREIVVILRIVHHAMDERSILKGST